GRPSRRAEIFAAALRLFRSRGFHATSINDIGAEAGVAGTAIYSHFSTKQELLAEAIREGAGRIGAGMRDAVAAEAATPDAALENVVRGYVEVVLDNADMNACYVLESRNLDAEVGEPLLRGERGLRKAFRDRLLAARPELTAHEAQTRVQMAIFSIVALCMHRSPVERDALVDLATSFVLGALRSPVPNPNP
ncbi:MAG: TetR/AcrR family transcriptional regulator, partial [Myxococcales bacterium]|nr:TetR/AcrR family transcriptional regulator [Myxococcales bacterium]